MRYEDMTRSTRYDSAQGDSAQPMSYRDAEVEALRAEVQRLRIDLAQLRAENAEYQRVIGELRAGVHVEDWRP